jgi:hypothetical protein
MLVYKYGALKPRVIGGTFEDLLAEQRLSNLYYNALVEIERWRIAARDLTEDLQMAPLDDAQKTEHRLAYNAACRAVGAATSIGWGQKQAVTEMVAAAMKTRRSDESKARARAARKQWPWVKRVMACARPRFRRYDGEGMLAATVQGATKLTVNAALRSLKGPVQIGPEEFRCADCRARDLRAKTPRFPTKPCGHRVITLRLRDGLSLEVPIVYHRPLPELGIKDGVPYPVRIIFARLIIDRIGDRWVYSVHLTLDTAAATRPKTGIGKCAINFGWRRVEGGVRVAYAVDDQGVETSLVIPDSLIGRQKHAESLRSLADGMATAHLGDARGRTRARREALADPSATHRELGRVRLTLEQAQKQDPADREHWARRDRHLYQWERDEYSGALRSRREIYRLWARQLFARYDSCVVEAFDMRSVVMRAPPGERQDEIPAARHYRFLVGPHYLRAEILSVFGEACEVLKPAKRTLTCHACGALCKWDKARELRHDCEGCGASWDQDANNSKNQLLDAAE